MECRKKLVPRHNGDWFVVSPWALTWDDENYYLVAFDDLDHRVKHYRVDKMMRISIEDEKREGREEFKNFDMAEYSKATFGMYQGQKTKVKIRFANYMWVSLLTDLARTLPSALLITSTANFMWM